MRPLSVAEACGGGGGGGWGTALGLEFGVSGVRVRGLGNDPKARKTNGRQRMKRLQEQQQLVTSHSKHHNMTLHEQALHSSSGVSVHLRNLGTDWGGAADGKMLFPLPGLSSKGS